MNEELEKSITLKFDFKMYHVHLNYNARDMSTSEGFKTYKEALEFFNGFIKNDFTVCYKAKSLEYRYVALYASYESKCGKSHNIKLEEIGKNLSYSAERSMRRRR